MCRCAQASQRSTCLPEQDGRENDVPILLALALLDPDEHPVTIDIGELERSDLRGSQAGGISQAPGSPCA